ncbi:hypothetical protein Kpol_538p21 [Vanderwaltozyma polyspora DSM 70294]|uniref:Skg3/CAF120-like PH-like domain-containing protein n=1 Tax=Vanderwaltozyma polyspora (strain ATCC 22028 / DSM 70294 / BCRC 21397 / CBS 2163 / NBRC 10782 / NRRL Y-8283 / UCD 57-17) TaxID=436907 RepID=A7TKD4_VANPO|nr:uncharacterized protein Kpol_538p21 [Vanderwaltozyma polyspora DSM 70294]EDO17261.1 hypothetical protein Kpol_538p21 [Vanderwaltozyma polyspora DSM 70294]
MGILNVLKKPITLSKLPEGTSEITSEATVDSSGKVFNPIDEVTYNSLKPCHHLLHHFTKKAHYVSPSDVSIVNSINNVSVAEISIVGNNLTVASNNGSKLVVPLIYSNFMLLGENEDLLLKFNDGLILKSTNENNDEILKIYRLSLLSCFELISLHKSMTGILISNVGLKMNDIHIILNNDKYNFKDWCYIKSMDSNVKSEWQKCWVHIDKSKKKNATIKFYKDNKNLSSKNILCYIESNTVSDIFAVPDNAGSTHRQFVDSVNSISIVGNVLHNTAIESSPTSPINSPQVHMRSTSIASAMTSMSNFSNTSAATNNSNTNSSISSTSTSTTTKSRKQPLIKSNNVAMNQSGLLIKPVAHSGISQLETLIRSIIPMIDATQLYGRPERFIVSKEDPKSLMFAFPRLPQTDYFNEEETNSYLSQPLPTLDELIENGKNPSSNSLAVSALADFIVNFRKYENK